MTPASRRASSCGSGGPISTASERRSGPSERRPFVRSVLPLETRSTIASARPSRGASSTEPCTSTSSIGDGSSSRASRGKLVATRAPASSSMPSSGDSSGTAASSVHAPKPSRCSSETRAARSRTMSSPVMPQSTTPSCTYSGMSSARTRSASTGALRHGNASARSPGASGPSPASSSSATAGSRSRPFEGTAILRRGGGAGAAVRARNRPRPGATTARRASRSSSTRARAAPPPGRAGPGPAAAPPASDAPSRRAPPSCRGRAGSAAPRPASAARRSSRTDLCVPSSANVAAPWLLPSCYHGNTLSQGFQLLPAVDVLAGRAVRLRQGDFDDVTREGGDPEQLVRRFAERKPPLLHVVALDAARVGGVPLELARALAAAAAPVPLQLGGGVRSPRDATALVEAGAGRVIVATAAFEQGPERYAMTLGGRLVVAVDVRDGVVRTHGWERATGLSVDEAVERCRDAGVARILCTAIDRDGTLGGPDLRLLERVAQRFGRPVLAAGGIRSQADLDALASLGLEGAVVGRALLDGLL